MPLIYNTRDAKGNDITKQVELKSFPVEAASFTCPICHKECEEGWIRLGYTTAKDLMHKGTIVFLKHNYPGIYNKLVQAFPECGAYI